VERGAGTHDWAKIENTISGTPACVSQFVTAHWESEELPGGILKWIV